MGRPSAENSNTELTNSLKANFEASIEAESGPETNGNGATHTQVPRSHFKSWTSSSHEGKTLYIPALDFTYSQLQEERDQYDITVKLFYLPGVSPSRREEQTREALEFVLQELHMPSIDLLIVSFPGIYFDEESEVCPDKIKSRGPVEADPEPLDTQVSTWQILEKLHDEGKVSRLGLSEFGTERLHPFLERSRIRPSVNQINLRDCCSVPKPLLALAKSNNIDLLVHNDSPNVLPRGTLRELLGSGPNGVGVLAGKAQQNGENQTQTNGHSTDGAIRGEVVPQWVAKYTAVVKDRGVVENKGYFAVAEVQD